jgi:hypothetical protein
VKNPNETKKPISPLPPRATPEQDSRSHQRFTDEGLSLEERERRKRDRDARK